VDGDWATLEAAVAEVLADCDNEEERQMILGRIAVVKAHLAKLLDDVEAKTIAHQMLAAHLEACNATEEKISQLLKHLQDDKLTADQILELRTDVDNARSQLLQLDSHSPEMKAVMTRANLVIKYRTTQAALNLDANIQKMLEHIDDGNSQLCLKADKLAEISETWRIYSDTKTFVQSDLQELQESVSAAEVEELSLAAIKEFMAHLLCAQKRWLKSAASFERLNSAKKQLAVLDPSSVDMTKSDCRQIETARNAFESALLGSIDSAGLVIENWQSFDETKTRIESVLTEVKSVLLKPTQLGSLQALRERLSEIKVFLTFMAFVYRFTEYSVYILFGSNTE